MIVSRTGVTMSNSSDTSHTVGPVIGWWGGQGGRGSGGYRGRSVCVGAGTGDDGGVGSTLVDTFSEDGLRERGGQVGSPGGALDSSVRSGGLRVRVWDSNQSTSRPLLSYTSQRPAKQEAGQCSPLTSGRTVAAGSEEEPGRSPTPAAETSPGRRVWFG